MRRIGMIVALGGLLSGCAKDSLPLEATTKYTHPTSPPEPAGGTQWERAAATSTQQVSPSERTAQLEWGLFFPERKPHPPPPETSKKLDIPRYDERHPEYAGQPFVYYSFAKQRERQLGLPAPELAQDEVFLRLWWTHQHGLTQPGTVFEFRKDHGTWTGRVLTYDVTFDAWAHYEKVSNARTRDFVPASGWQMLERIVEENEIPTLPTCEHVKDYAYWMRDQFKRNPPEALSTYSIEYATPETYRFYVYDSPVLIREKVREAALLCRFGEALANLDSAGKAVNRD